MKKLMYLFVAGTMFAFTACGGGETATEEAKPEDVIKQEQADSDAEQAASDTAVTVEETDSTKAE